MIEVKDLHVSYGEFLAVKGVSFTVNEGELVAIIGANGAGKSTILMSLMGLRKCQQGQIFFGNNFARINKICGERMRLFDYDPSFTNE